MWVKEIYLCQFARISVEITFFSSSFATKTHKFYYNHEKREIFLMINTIDKETRREEKKMNYSRKLIVIKVFIILW